MRSGNPPFSPKPDPRGNFLDVGMQFHGMGGWMLSTAFFRRAAERFFPADCLASLGPAVGSRDIGPRFWAAAATAPTAAPMGPAMTPPMTAPARARTTRRRRRRRMSCVVRLMAVAVVTVVFFSGTFTRILTVGCAAIPTGLARPFFAGAFGSGMTMRVSHEGQIMRRPLQSPAARMFWPHLGQSN